jgi:small nuclear ribonucleoprotein (snRNP)-like protein
MTPRIYSAPSLTLLFAVAVAAFAGQEPQIPPTNPPPQPPAGASNGPQPGPAVKPPGPGGRTSQPQTTQHAGAATRSASGKTVTVTLPSGQTYSGKLDHLDDFSVSLTDSSGEHHAWLFDEEKGIQVKVNDPRQAHQELLSQYSNADMHNILAYLETLKREIAAALLSCLWCAPGLSLAQGLDPGGDRQARPRKLAEPTTATTAVGASVCWIRSTQRMFAI